MRTGGMVGLVGVAAMLSCVGVVSTGATTALPSMAVGAVLAGQDGAGDGAQELSLHERADRAFRAGDFQRAEDLYLDITGQHPDDALAWYRLAYSLHAQGELERAMSYHKRAASFDHQRAPALYNLACAEALLGRTERAFESLEEAASAGFADAATMEGDSDLDSLRDDDRFGRLLQQVRENGTDAPLRAFDFWVGTWDVFNPEGKLVGHSVVRKLHNGHVIEENWISAGGNTGMSMNFYDPQKGSWRQVWVSMSGDVVEYAGSFSDGAMRFEGEHVKLDGTRSLQRATFTPGEEGTVRQFIEASSDGGETWNVYFDGTYVMRVLPLENPPE